MKQKGHQQRKAPRKGKSLANIKRQQPAGQSKKERPPATSERQESKQAITLDSPKSLEGQHPRRLLKVIITVILTSIIPIIVSAIIGSWDISGWFMPPLTVEAKQNTDNLINTDFIFTNVGRLQLTNVKVNIFTWFDLPKGLIKDLGDSGLIQVPNPIFRDPFIDLGNISPGDSRTARLPFNEYWQKIATGDAFVCFEVSFHRLSFWKGRQDFGFLATKEPGGDHWIRRLCESQRGQAQKKEQ